ncbi:MAG: hypothetical protein PHC53_02545 [Patescibacteria group bacterium]|nr:hypothetical protein [Patescibacteria group bacterium]
MKNLDNEKSTNDLNVPGGEAKAGDEKDIAQEGTRANEPANLSPGDVKKPESTHHVLCEEELTRISNMAKFYSKRMKLTSWCDDTLWLIQQLERAINVADDFATRVNVFSKALDKLTNGGFAELHKAGPLWTEKEDRELTAEQKEERINEFLHKRTCCRCGGKKTKAGGGSGAESVS